MTALPQQLGRARFIPARFWLIDPDTDELIPVDQHTNPAAWADHVSSDVPLVTQLSDHSGDSGQRWPTSSCSQPSLVAGMLDALQPRRGHRVLEIGTGTGWNAALLCRAVGADGTVTTIEVDPEVADQARHNLHQAGHAPHLVVGDGEAGHFAYAPYDRIIATCSVNDAVPTAWLAQLRTGGRLVVPWGNDWLNGVMLTVDTHRCGATGVFSGNLAFMRLRQHHASTYDWRPTPQQLDRATWDESHYDGEDLRRMCSHDEAAFAVGAVVGNCYLDLRLNQHGPWHHHAELDDYHTGSWAEIDMDVDANTPCRVRQLGPRRLWDEITDAYGWWYDHRRPGPQRFGFDASDGTQRIWLDRPGNHVRTLAE